MRIDGGYFDIQINGGWGHHFSDDPSTIWAVASRLVEHGVTQFLPTLISEGFAKLDDALDVLAAGPPAGWVGAEPVGWHLEGPWLAPSRAGAHAHAALQQPDVAALSDRLCRSGGVALVTLAPELPGALEMIAALVERGVVVSLGHSDATADQAIEGFAAGARMGTHVFNAMSGLHHRHPGLAAALLEAHDDGDGPAVGLIADGAHVDPRMVDLVRRLVGARVLLVSDAVSILGTAGADRVAVRRDGTLIGATVGIDTCVRNFADFTGCSIEVAAAAASVAPRRLLSVAAPSRCFAELDEAGAVVRTVIDDVVVGQRLGTGEC